MTLALGYEGLRQQQIVVEHFLRGNDVFVSLPTGSGKSLCYCLLPKAFDLLRDSNSVTKQSIAVVVSPQSRENCMDYHDISHLIGLPDFG